MKRPWDAIVWWEIHRIPYNIFLAGIGLVTVAILFWVGSHFVGPGEDVEEPVGLLVGVILYGIAANALYTLGWITELLWSWGDTSRTEALRRRVFYAGLIVSSIITLLPAALIPALWVVFGFQHTTTPAAVAK